MSAKALLTPPDIARWRRGNTGVDYVHRCESGAPGPHVLITALMHGNEACGAVALDRLLAQDFLPSRGVATLAFLNVAAYVRLDPSRPELGRFVDEDMNRVWSPDRLDGPERTVELQRARAVRPFADAADYLLDLHSMTEGNVPLALCGTTAKGMALARRIGYPATVVADPGHAGGRRLRDYGPFGTAGGKQAALLVECGQHFAAASAVVAYATALRFLAAFDMLDPTFAAAEEEASEGPAQRFIEVTDVVTIETEAFAFAERYRSLDVIPATGTLIARDGEREVRTPYDDCVLIMPAKKIKPSLTAVRLGRFVETPAAAP
jgi:predicted deacylase